MYRVVGFSRLEPQVERDSGVGLLGVRCHKGLGF